VVRIGWPDQFIEHGKIEDLRVKYGLSVDNALSQVLPLLARGKPHSLVTS
jgi:1-deoxy-D-xylulose-5-phosphate synthase